MMKRNLLFLLTFIVSTMTVWAQYSEESYYLTLEPNYEGCPSYLPIAVGYPYTWTLSATAFIRSGHTIEGWAESATGAAIYGANEQITLTGDLTLYAIWDDSPSVLTYTFNETSKTAALTGYGGAKPTGILEIPATVTVDNVEYSMTSIGQDAFSNCTGLTSVTIPASVTSIGGSAFKNCNVLTSVYVLATTPPALGANAFSGNASNRKIYVPANSVGDSDTNGTYKHDWSAYAYDIEAFPVTASGNCGNPTLTDVSWTLYGNGLLVISGTGAMNDFGINGAPWYDYRASITSVEIGSGVTSIGNYAFDGCSGLTSINIPNSVTSIGVDAFYGCTNLTSVTISNSVTSIGTYAFKNCTSLTSITIPASVTNIGYDAFESCFGLTSITIPASVTSIGLWAFANCTNLTSVTIYAPSLTDYCIGVFDNNASGRKIYVFSDCVNAYKLGWSDYASAIEPITEVAVSGVSANQNPESAADYWCTYYHPAANVIINTTGVEIYKAKINDNKTSVTLEKVEGNVIKAGQAVMLKAPASGSLSMELTPNAATGDYTDNDLKGGTTVETGYTAYTLAAKNNKMGFYKFTGTALNGNKAHLELPTIAASRAFIGFDAETTKIVNTDYSDNTDEGDGQIYDLQGRKVQQPVRGIYVQNGKKIVVK